MTGPSVAPVGHRRRPGGGAGVRCALLLVVVLAAACGSGSGGAGSAGADPTAVPVEAPAERGQPQLPVTVRSADGREVTVTDVSRIVPLQGNLAEAVFALGLGDRVVGRDISATFDEAAELPLVTRAHDVSAESVLSLRPTVVLADTDTGPPEALDLIRDVGIPVVVLDVVSDVDGIGGRIRAVAEALGVDAVGDAVAADVEAEVDQVRADAPRGGEPPRVAFLYLRGQASVYLLGGAGSGADSMIAAAGGIDAGTEIGLDQPFTPITSEALVEAAPEVLLVTTTGLESVGGVEGLVAIPGVAQTPAGRDRRVVTVEDGLLYSFGTRTPEALRQLAEGLDEAPG